MRRNLLHPPKNTRERKGETHLPVRSRSEVIGSVPAATMGSVQQAGVTPSRASNV